MCVCVCVHLSVCLLLVTSQRMVHRPPMVTETSLSMVHLSGTVYWLNCVLRTCLPSPPVDIIWAMMIVWRLQGKIIRTVLCCVVYGSCTQWYTHTSSLGSSFSFCVCLRLAFCVLFWYSLDYLVLVLFAFIVLDLVFLRTMPRDWLKRTAPQWPILCWVGRKTLTQSINQQTIRY